MRVETARDYGQKRSGAVYVILLAGSLSFAKGGFMAGGMVGTTEWHVVALVVLVGCGLWFLSKSPLQRILDAVREDELVRGLARHQPRLCELSSA